MFEGLNPVDETSTTVKGTGGVINGKIRDGLPMRVLLGRKPLLLS